MIQGVVASIIFLTSVFLSVSGGQTTIQEAYDILVNLTILIYFVPVPVPVPGARPPARLFPDGTPSMPTKAGRRTSASRAAVLGLGLVAGAGFLATADLARPGVHPAGGTTNLLNYEGNLVGQAAIILALGGGVYLAVAAPAPPGPRERRR